MYSKVIKRTGAVSLIMASCFLVRAQVMGAPASHRIQLSGHLGQTAMVEEIQPGILLIQLIGAGDVSGLGHVIFEAEQTADLSNGTVVGEGTFIRPDAGDELYFSYEGETTAPSETGFADFRVLADFTGGTGEFTDARGRAVLEGIFAFGIPDSCDGIAGTGSSTIRGRLRN